MKPVILEDVPEVDIPTRYLYFVVGSAAPKKGEKVTCDVGIAMVLSNLVHFCKFTNIHLFMTYPILMKYTCPKC